MRNDLNLAEDATHAFCETIHGIVWHIRPLSSLGPKFGGGADKPSLCGHKIAWDLDVAFIPEHFPGVCPMCVALFRIEKP